MIAFELKLNQTPYFLPINKTATLRQPFFSNLNFISQY